MSRFKWNLLAVVGLLVLAACSPGPSGPAGGAATAAPVVRFAGGNGPVEDQLIAALQEVHPEIRVERVSRSALPGGWSEATTQLIRQGDVDVAWLPGDAVPLVEEGLLQDLQPYLAETDTAAQLPEFRGLRWEGHLYVLPWTATTQAVYVNLDQLAAYGEPPPELGWTWDDLKALVDRLCPLADEAPPLRIENGPGFLSLLAQQAGQHPDGLDPAGVQAALGFLRQLRQEGSCSRVAGLDEPRSGDPMAAFWQGRQPLMVSAAGFLNDAPSDLSFRWRVLPVPVPPGREPVVVLTPALLVMAAEPTNPRAAWDFMHFMAGPEAAAVLGIARGPFGSTGTDGRVLRATGRRPGVGGGGSSPDAAAGIPPPVGWGNPINPDRVRVEEVTPTVGGRGQEKTALMAIDPWTFGQVAWSRADLFAPYHLNDYLNLLASGWDGALVSARFLQRHRLRPGDEIGVRSADGREVTLTVYAGVSYWPGLLPEQSDFIIANRDAIEEGLGLYPYRTWLRLQPGADPTALVKGLQAEGIRVYRADDARGLWLTARREPQLTGLLGILTISFGLALGLGAIGYGLHGLRSLGGRMSLMAVLRALGAERRQVATALGLEFAAVATAGLGGGVGLGWVAARLLVPTLASQTGMAGSAPPFVTVIRLGDMLPVLLLFAVLTLTGVLGLWVLGLRTPVGAVLRWNGNR